MEKFYHFLPVVNSIVAVPQQRDRTEFIRDLQSKNKRVIKDVPVEYIPFLGKFLQKTSLPFSVVFDPKLTVDSQLKGDVLRIHPRSLYDQDPREVFLETWGELLWPRYERLFRTDYVATLTKMGLVRPSKTVKTIKEYWISEFVSFKLNQMDTPMELLWFRTNVKE